MRHSITICLDTLLARTTPTKIRDNDGHDVMLGLILERRVYVWITLFAATWAATL